MEVTRAAVLAAITECDILGADAFLAAHGYGKPSSYVLEHNGRTYPSKAILGVAAGLKAKEFSGGAAHVGRILSKLGFTVRGVGRILAAMFLAASALGYTGAKSTTLNDGPVAFFASGANHPGEILGFAKIGHDVGVAANEIRPAAEAALARLRGTDVQVFLDSGAFSEVEETPTGLVVAHPITDAEWQKRLGLAQRLADVLGDQLHVVAPDRIGSQVETLARLTTYAPAVRALRAAGARILVAMQRGELAREAFALEVDRVLGFTDWTPALPMKKAPMLPREIEAFLSARQPRTLHLLGLGMNSKLAPAVFAAIRRASPDCLVTCDSNEIRRNVGKTNGVGNGPRAFTAALGVLPRIFSRFASWSGLRRKKAATILCFGWSRWQGAPAVVAAPQLTLALPEPAVSPRRAAALKAWVTIRARRAAVRA
jgi:hypothetical protein